MMLQQRAGPDVLLEQHVATTRTQVQPPNVKKVNPNNGEEDGAKREKQNTKHLLKHCSLARGGQVSVWSRLFAWLDVLTTEPARFLAEWPLHFFRMEQLKLEGKPLQEETKLRALLLANLLLFLLLLRIVTIPLHFYSDGFISNNALLSLLSACVYTSLLWFARWWGDLGQVSAWIAVFYFNAMLTINVPASFCFP